ETGQQVQVPGRTAGIRPADTEIRAGAYPGGPGGARLRRSVRSQAGHFPWIAGGLQGATGRSAGGAAFRAAQSMAGAGMGRGTEILFVFDLPRWAGVRPRAVSGAVRDQWHFLSEL